MSRKAISIRQPWLWLITRPDVFGDEARRELYRLKQIKDFENRSRDLGNLMAITGSPDVWLHASKAPADDFDFIRLSIDRTMGIKIPTLKELPRGGICGRATFDRFVDEFASPWAVGSGYPIFSASAVRFIECKGALGFFNLPATVKLPI